MIQAREAARWRTAVPQSGWVWVHYDLIPNYKCGNDLVRADFCETYECAEYASTDSCEITDGEYDVAT